MENAPQPLQAAPTITNTIRLHLDWIIQSRANRATWQAIAKELARLGVRTTNGKALSQQYLSSVVGRLAPDAPIATAAKRQASRQTPPPARAASQPARPSAMQPGGGSERMGEEVRKPNAATDDLAAEIDAIYRAEAETRPQAKAMSITAFLEEEGLAQQEG